MATSGGETGTVVVLFTDLVESTAMATIVGAEAADSARRDHFAQLRAELGAHRGTEIKTTGDGLMVVFTTATDALDAAVAMQRAVTPVPMRIGVSAGDAVVEDGDWFGDPVVEAARLCAGCDACSIVVADVVRRLAGRRSGHRFESLGAMELKGLPEPILAYGVDWEPDGEMTDVVLPSTLTVARGRFVGRAHDVERITAVWRRATEAGGRVMAAIAGEPGIGKSRLAAEAAAILHADGARVLHGRCDEAGAAPYQPIVEALAQLSHGVDQQSLRRLLGPSGRELVRLFPDLGDRVPGLGRPTLAEPDGERRLLFEAIDAVIERLAVDTPVLLVIDDIHWADQPTLLLVRHLLRSHRAGPLVILATYRETELGRTHPLADALADLRHDHLVERIVLRGLAETDVAEMVQGWPSIVDTDSPLAASVYAETEGNPFFVEEVLRHVVEVGSTARGVPEGIREVTGRRLSRLSEDANTVLSVAAVVGREFDIGVLEAVTRLSDEVVLDGLDAALGAGLLVEGTRAGRYAFAHALVRQTLYEELSLTRRVRMHWRVGEAIAARADAGERASEVAHHLGTGVLEGDVTVAVDACLAAAQAASDLAAIEEVAAFADRALAMLDEAGRDEPDRRARAHLHQAWALRPVSMGAAWQAYREAGIAAERGNDSLLYYRSVYLCGLTLSPEPERFLEQIRDARARLGEDHPMETATLWGTEVIQTTAAWGRAEAAPARAHLDAALAVLGDDPRGQWLATAVRIVEALGSPEFAGAIRALDLPSEEESLDLTEEQLFGGLLIKITVPIGALVRGDLAAFQRTIDEFDAEASERLLSSTQMQTGWYRTAVALARGPISAAKAEISMRRKEHGSDVPNFAHQLGVAYIAEGQIDRAIDGIRLFMTTPRGIRDDLAMRASIASALVEAGRTDEAAHALDELARNDFADLPDDLMRPLVLRHLAELCGEVAHRRGATALRPMLEPYAGQVLVTHIAIAIEGAADRPLGVIALTLGDLDEAVERLSAAAALEDRCGFAVLAARTRFWWARALIARGETADAREMLANVVAAADALGLAPLSQRASRLCAEVG